MLVGARPAFSFKFQRKKVKTWRWFVENVLGLNSMRKTLFLLIVFVYVLLFHLLTKINFVFLSSFQVK